ncbi:MAG: hypothetical protein H8E38_08405 [SAR324 cluster bacterium]|nr:hypothetical protein [SAR324 cluster bacterium]
MKSFDSNDKAFEERFDPQLRTIGESHLQKHDEDKVQPPSSSFFRLEFSKSIPAESKAFLQDSIPACIDFPGKFGLRIQNAGHILRFLDQHTYETEVGTALPSNVILPASRIENAAASKTYRVTIILPNKLDSAKVVVNITRNIYSKLFGNIFFKEQILPLEFYQQSLYGRKQISAAIPEILDLVEELNYSADSLKSHCESVAQSYRLSMEKQGAEIQQQLLKEWREKWQNNSLSTEEQHTLGSVFSEFMESYRTDPARFNQTVIERIKKLNTQLHFILPHERRAYEKFEQEHFTHYIRTVLHKLEEISALSGFVAELYQQFSTAPTELELDGIGREIRSRMKQMRKENKVILFYVPEVPQNSDLEQLRKNFPLKMIKMLPSGILLKDWSKTIKSIENNYAESLYTKLYSALYSLSEWSQVLQDSEAVAFEQSEEGQRLKKLVSILKYRAPAIRGIQSSLGILLDTNEQTDLHNNSGSARQRQLLPLDDFSKAWNYFSSSVLTMLFYQESTASAVMPQGFRADNYLKSIFDFIDKQCTRGINHFHIIKLLWLVYEKKRDAEDFSFLLYCISNPQVVLRYTLHQVMLPLAETSTLELRIKKLSQYSGAWLTAYKNRLAEAID